MSSSRDYALSANTKRTLFVGGFLGFEMCLYLLQTQPEYKYNPEAHHPNIPTPLLKSMVELITQTGMLAIFTVLGSISAKAIYEVGNVSLRAAGFFSSDKPAPIIKPDSQVSQSQAGQKLKR